MIELVKNRANKVDKQEVMRVGSEQEAMAWGNVENVDRYTQPTEVIMETVSRFDRELYSELAKVRFTTLDLGRVIIEQEAGNSRGKTHPRGAFLFVPHQSSA